MSDRLDPAVAAVRSAVRAGCADLEPGTSVLVACSGGADSMALAAATIFEAGRAGWLVSVAIVDHGLQAGSADLAATVAERVRAIGCDDVEVLAAQVDATGGPENAAREARYAVLDELALRRDAVVLLGHTRDDQAETVLLRLARGSGVRSLAAMPTRRDRLRRPLLALPRSTTEAACEALGLVTWSDPHNTERRFSRVRVRSTVLPVLEAELGPGVAAALARTAWLARDDADALDGWGQRTYDAAVADDGSLDVGQLATEPASIRRRVIRLAALAAGAPGTDLTAEHLAAVDALLTSWHGQRGIDLPGRLVARRVEGRLHVAPVSVEG